jgi:MFS family permease
MTPEVSGGVSWREVIADGHLLRVAVLCCGVWLHAADAMLVATVMPAAIEEIGGLPYVNWTITLYELGSITAGAMTGFIVLRLGVPNTESLAAAVYAAGCVMSALAPDIATVIVGRLLQGIGGGAMIALAFVAISTLFPSRLWPRLMAIVSTIWGASALCGPLIGGYFASVGFWRGAFWAFALQGVMVLLASQWLLKVPERASETSSGSIPFARLGFLCLAVLSIAQSGVEPSVIGSTALCLGGLLLLIVTLRWDARSSNRIFPSQTLNFRSNAGLGLAIIFFLPIAAISFVTYGPLLMHILYDAAPLTSGYMLALESVGWTVAALTFSGAEAKREKVIIRLGAFLVLFGTCGFAVIMPQGPMLALVPCALLQGAGFGMFWTFLIRRIVLSVPEKERTSASSTIAPLQRFGYAVGSALCGLVANGAGFSAGASVEKAESVGFWVFAAFVPLLVGGNIAAWVLTGRRRSPVATPA